MPSASDSLRATPLSHHVMRCSASLLGIQSFPCNLFASSQCGMGKCRWNPPGANTLPEEAQPVAEFRCSLASRWIPQLSSSFMLTDRIDFQTTNYMCETGSRSGGISFAGQQYRGKPAISQPAHSSPPPRGCSRPYPQTHVPIQLTTQDGVHWPIFRTKNYSTHAAWFTSSRSYLETILSPKFATICRYTWNSRFTSLPYFGFSFRLHEVKRNVAHTPVLSS